MAIRFRCSSSELSSCVGRGVDLGLDRGHELLLALTDPLELGGEALLERRHIGAPVDESLLDRPLCVGQGGAQLRGRIALALGDIPPALVGDAALLLGEHRQRVRARECEVLLELGCPNLRLLSEHGVEAGLAALDLLVERAHRAPHPHVGGDRDRGGDAGDDGGSDGGVGHGTRLGAP